MFPMDVAESRRVLCDSLYATAHSMYESEPVRAISLFQLLAKLRPTDERGWLGTGACHEAVEADDVALSIYTFGQGAARSARCAAARARVLAKLGRVDDAAEVIDHALTLSWGDDDADLLERERERLP